MAVTLEGRWLELETLLAVACAAMTAFSIIGCSGSNGPQRFDVSGTVKLDGNLVPKGLITLIPTGGTQGPSVGGEITEGKFHIPKAKGPLAGDFIFQFTGTSDTPSGKYLAIKGHSKEALMLPAFPAKYGAASSEVRRIDQESHVFDFELTSK